MLFCNFVFLWKLDKKVCNLRFHSKLTFKEIIFPFTRLTIILIIFIIIVSMTMADNENNFNVLIIFTINVITIIIIIITRRPFPAKLLLH